MPARYLREGQPKDRFMPVLVYTCAFEFLLRQKRGYNQNDWLCCVETDQLNFHAVLLLKYHEQHLTLQRSQNYCTDPETYQIENLLGIHFIPKEH